MKKERISYKTIGIVVGFIWFPLFVVIGSIFFNDPIHVSAGLCTTPGPGGFKFGPDYYDCSILGNVKMNLMGFFNIFGLTVYIVLSSLSAMVLGFAGWGGDEKRKQKALNKPSNPPSL